MDLKRVEQLLRQYAGLLMPERLFSEEKAAQLRDRLAPTPRRGDQTESEAAPAALGGARMPGRWAARKWALAGGALLVTAAAVLLAVLLPSHRGTAPPTLGLTIDVAAAKSDLFHATRGSESGPGSTAPTSRPPEAAPTAQRPETSPTLQAPETSATPARPAGRFYVGVRLAQPAYVRLLALDDHGRWEQLPLDRAGSRELHVAAGSDTAFGGYERQTADAAGQKSNVACVVVLASAAPVDAGALTQCLSALSAPPGETPRAAADRLAAELRSQFRCETKVAAP